MTVCRYLALALLLANFSGAAVAAQQAVTAQQETLPGLS